MKNFITLAIISLSFNAYATGFLKSEKISGTNKICTYSTIYGDETITIKSSEVCAPSI